MLKCNPKELHGKEIFQNPLGAIRHLWVSFYVTKELFKCYVSLINKNLVTLERMLRKCEFGQQEKSTEKGR